MLSDHWPTFGIRIATPRLELRLPDDAEIAALADVAAGGVHPPEERPFLTPWAEGTPLERARDVLGGHWEQLAQWRPSHWRLGLGVFVGGETPVGIVTLRARDFAVTREVSTASWLGLDHQRRGYGTEARVGVLALAFDHLGATDATTEVFPDNAASQGVSRRLGYRPDGISRDARGTEVLVSDRLRLTRAQWSVHDGPTVVVSGVERALPMFEGTAGPR